MKQKSVLLGVLALALCMPSFADEYAPKKNPNFCAKVFTVSPKRKVYFTQGNLIYQRFDDGDIAFMTKQWDIFQTYSSQYPHWVNMHTFVNNDVYLLSSRIINGKMQNIVHYRCMTASEWTFILESRPKADQLQSLARVNDVNGYILLPDSWILPTGLHFTPKTATFDGNVYSIEEWTKMELAGAVFLPASGDVYSWFGLNNVNKEGSYWTSSTSAYSNQYAGRLFFKEQHNAEIVTTKKDELAVAIRLVYDAK